MPAKKHGRRSGGLTHKKGWRRKNTKKIEPDAEIYLNLLTVNQLCRAFNVARMTVYNWRRYKGLPYIIIPSIGLMRKGEHTIRFELERVLDWAAEHEAHIDDPKVLEENNEAFAHLLDNPSGEDTG